MPESGFFRFRFMESGHELFEWSASKRQTLRNNLTLLAW
jgi:hypothetical protein